MIEDIILGNPHYCCVVNRAEKIDATYETNTFSSFVISYSISFIFLCENTSMLLTCDPDIVVLTSHRGLLVTI